MTVGRSHGSRYALGWPVGKRSPAGRWLNAWGCIAHPMGHWLARDEAGGLQAWLALSMPPGTPLSRSPEVLAAMEQALRQPAGLASAAARHQGVPQTHHLEGNDHTLSTLVRTRFKAIRKVPRPRHTQNPCGHSCVAGDLCSAAAVHHAIGAYPPGACVAPGRPSRRVTDGASPTADRRRGPPCRAGPAHL
jgi:hypothetical protein